MEIGAFYRITPMTLLWRSSWRMGYYPAPNDLLPHPDPQQSGPIVGGKIIAINSVENTNMYSFANLLILKPDGTYDFYHDQDLVLEVPMHWRGGNYMYNKIEQTELPLSYTIEKHAKNQAFRNVYEERTNQTSNSMPANLIRAYAGMNRPPSHIKAAMIRRRNGLGNSDGGRRSRRRKNKTSRKNRK
jgi:hypothetical protein